MPFYREADSLELSMKHCSGNPKGFEIKNLFCKIINEQNVDFFVLFMRSEVDLV